MPGFEKLPEYERAERTTLFVSDLDRQTLLAKAREDGLDVGAETERNRALRGRQLTERQTLSRLLAHYAAGVRREATARGDDLFMAGIASNCHGLTARELGRIVRDEESSD